MSFIFINLSLLNMEMMHILVFVEFLTPSSGYRTNSRWIWIRKPGGGYLYEYYNVNSNVVLDLTSFEYIIFYRKLILFFYLFIRP